MNRKHSIDSLSDNALLCQFGDLVRQDREGNANLLRHIDSIDSRKLWAKLGHPSMFAFLVVRHHMSESTAAKRIGAARTARRFPILFDMVARGDIHLSGIHRLKTHLTPENHEHVLEQAKHQTIRQIEALVARLAPQPDVPSTLRALPTRTAGAPAPATASPAPPLTPATTPEPPPPAGASASPALPVPRRSPDPAPLSPGRYKLQVTLGEKAKNQLKQLQDLRAHQIPNSDPATIVERALEALLTQVQKCKVGSTDQPRVRKLKPRLSSTASVNARRSRIPVAVRREVWTLHPWAKGGADTAINLGLRCRAHNAWEADRDYGTSFMAGKRGRNPLKVREPVVRYLVSRGQRPSLTDRQYTEPTQRQHQSQEERFKSRCLDQSFVSTMQTGSMDRGSRPAANPATT